MENLYREYALEEIFFLKDQFRPPTYELSVVSSCASCPPYPPATSGWMKIK